LYGYSETLEEYLDIWIIWVFINLGRIFGYRDYIWIYSETYGRVYGYRDYMDIFRNLWKSIWI